MAKQIEQDLKDAIRNGANWRSGHTETVVSDATGNISVLLHGSIIARVEKGAKDVFVSLAGYNTSVTRSRINSVMELYGLDKVANKSGAPVMGGVVLPSSGWVQVMRDGRGITPEAAK